MSSANVTSRYASPLSIEYLRQRFRALGLEPGMSVIVHSSLGSMGWVCGGPLAVVYALQDVLGSEGTLMMPAHTPENTEPSRWRNPPVPESWWAEIRRNMPAFDPACTPSQGMGAIAETFRALPGVLRSSHPVGSFCAWGKHATHLVKRHRLENEFGQGSPLERFYDLDGEVLLLGVGYNRNTSLHLSEHRANYASKTWQREGCAMLVNRERAWVEYEMLALDSDDFEAIGEAFEAAHPIREVLVGAARARLISQQAIVDFGARWMEEHR